ncbi:MAG: DUF92 domain-containing protein [Mucilaginibacter sp.]|uniref:DUF92 domain-containing protein n=1 Tax=Mucilaginibacter sp. TaxID=1882438 RepID=UPI0031A6E200
MLARYGLLAIILIAGVVYSLSARKLTLIAAITSTVIACLVFTGAGFTGVAMMTTLFILASAATSWKRSEKLVFEPEGDHKKGRTAGQVMANTGVAAIAGVMVWIFPSYMHLWILMMAASLASANADTLSSELGMVYGRRFLNIISLKPDKRGLDGVVSLEGTLIGIGGSIIIAVVYAIGFGWNAAGLITIIIAGTVGNLADSVLGATLERGKYIGNNAVNFLNTLIAALVALLIYFI